MWRKRGRIIGIIMMHIDDFYFGEKEFHRGIIGRIKEKLKIGEEKEEDFRYLEVMIENEEGRIRLDYKGFC